MNKPFHTLYTALLAVWLLVGLAPPLAAGEDKDTKPSAAPEATEATGQRERGERPRPPAADSPEGRMLLQMLEMSDEELAALRRTVERCQRMSPEEKERLRQRIERFHELDRDRRSEWRRRFEQIPPDVRKKMQEDWEAMTPEEREKKQQEWRTMNPREREQYWRDLGVPPVPRDRGPDAGEQRGEGPPRGDRPPPREGPAGE